MCGLIRKVYKADSHLILETSGMQPTIIQKYRIICAHFTTSTPNVEPNIYIMNKWAVMIINSNTYSGDFQLWRFYWTCDYWPPHVVIQVIIVKA